jgi:hypothetical protein
MAHVIGMTAEPFARSFPIVDLNKLHIHTLAVVYYYTVVWKKHPRTTRARTVEYVYTSENRPTILFSFAAQSPVEKTRANTQPRPGQTGSSS